MAQMKVQLVHKLWRKKQHKPVPTSPLVETCSLASGKGLFLAEDRPRCWMKDSK